VRIGVFFGGPARERDVSFMGGRTALRNLDQRLFQAVAVFVSGSGRFFVVDESFWNVDLLREALPQDESGFSVYDESLDDDWCSGMLEIRPGDFHRHFDCVFLAMHGPDCEDGAIQGLLEWYKIPYTGPGLLGSSLGINKILQNDLIALVNGQQKKTLTISRDSWQQCNHAEFFQSLIAHIGLPVVVKAPHQGSSIGVAIVKENDLTAFSVAVETCFFQTIVTAEYWNTLKTSEKQAYAQRTTDLDKGIGFPLIIEQTGETITHPATLIERLNQHFGGSTGTDTLSVSRSSALSLVSQNAEDEVLFEEFIVGQEFSCGVIQDDDQNAFALPPTEIYNAAAFDFETKYKSNTVKKRIPVGTTLENNRQIQQIEAEVFKRLGINVYARTDGFLTADNRVLLHDPNTIPGMSPTSLIFKQMAEIGMDICNTLTYLIRQSLRERIRTGKDTVRLRHLLADLDTELADRKANPAPQETLAFGPTDAEFASTKADYSRLAATGAVRPVLVYQPTDAEGQPVPVHLLVKETIADLDEALSQPRHPLILETIERTRHITERYLL
jgi:D-alanine-D-alanine ligase